jgi:DNA polymerase-1
VSESAGDELWIIDGHAQFFRAYHAIRGGMTSPITNEPTHMVFGFTATLLKLLRERKPRRLVLVIDAAGDRGTFRSEIYPEYKAHREPPPEDFRPQVERCVEVCRLLGIPVVAVPRVEADDAIATIVHRVRRAHARQPIRILSRDKDLGQLLDDHAVLVDGQTGQMIDAEGLFEGKGVKPSQVVDMLTLMGDPVDNVPGAKGIGPKTAATLITQYGSLDSLLENLDKLTPAKRGAIEAVKDAFPLTRRLVSLKHDCEVEAGVEDRTFDPAHADAPALMELMHVLGFHRLRSEMAAVLGVAPAVESAKTPEAAQRPAPARVRKSESGPSLFDEPSGESQAPVLEGITRDGSYAMLGTVREIEAFAREARAACARGAVLSFDTETDALAPTRCGLVGVSLAFESRRGVYIPVRSPQPERHLDWEAVRPLLKPLLEDPAVPKTAHNAKYDLIVLERHGVSVQGLVDDTLVSSHLVDAARVGHGLDALAEALLGHRNIPIESLIGSGRTQRRFDQADLDLATEYAAEDADIALRLHAHFAPQIAAQGLRNLLDTVELPLVRVIARMERWGIRVDAAELDRQREGLERRLAEIRTQVIAASPREFNLDSPRQLAEVLFNAPDDSVPGLGLKVIKRTKTGASTDMEVLEKLAADPMVDTPVPSLVLQHRQLSKLVGTYLVGLKEAIDPADGRVHASFHQLGAATGRLSSSDPNLQNIPIRTGEGREIRKAFKPEAGFVFVSADYSQIELRLLAHLSGDPGLSDAFRRGEDIHRAVAAQTFGVPMDRVSEEQRSAAKMVNFGIVYGITPWGLARRLGPGASVEHATRIIHDYKARFERIQSFLEACVDKAKTDGFVSTILGRRRPIPQVHSRNPAERALGERMAINTVVQGSAADLIKVAMVRLADVLPTEHPRARLLLQVHDELLVEVPEGEADAVLALVQRVMEGAMKLDVPLKADGGIGHDWFEA